MPAPQNLAPTLPQRRAQLRPTTRKSRALPVLGSLMRHGPYMEAAPRWLWKEDVERGCCSCWLAAAAAAAAEWSERSGVEARAANVCHDEAVNGKV